MRLQDKVTIVTGAGRGIGAATARRFAAEGAAVCCADINGDAAAEVAEAIRAAGGRALGLRADVSEPSDNAAMVAATVDAFGGLDVLYANAGAQAMGPMEEATPADWEIQFRTNLLGVAEGIRQALPALRARGGGSVIMTASVVALAGDDSMPVYGAMKGALTALSRSLAVAYGPENIRVNTICPGDVATAMLDRYFAQLPDGDAARERAIEHCPLRRFATPEDVAAVATFLASDDAAFLTGIDIRVDGGLLTGVY